MGRIRDSQKSREDILNAAEQEFAEKGIYGSRIDEIARQAGIKEKVFRMDSPQEIIQLLQE